MRGLKVPVSAASILLFIALSGTAIAQSWGPWQSMSKYDGVDMRVSCGDIQGSKNRWFVEFRNRYKQEASFDFRITREGESPAAYTDRVRIPPGGTSGGWNDVETTCGRGYSVTVWTSNWQFAEAHQQQAPAQRVECQGEKPTCCAEKYPRVSGQGRAYAECVCRLWGRDDFDTCMANMRRQNLPGF